MRALSAIAFLLALAACGGAPCKTFCEMDCKNAVTCSGGGPPTGATLDSCVNGCTDAVKAAGIKDDSACDCSTGSCSSNPEGVFIHGFKC